MDDGFTPGFVGGILFAAALSFIFGVLMIGPMKTEQIRTRFCAVMEHHSSDIPVRWNDDYNRCEAQMSESVWVNVESIYVGE